MNDFFMRRALELARKGVGFVSPNPAVGCVIVKGGRIIGEGWHRKAGGDHAEVDAIKRVKNKSLLKGADMYVTLEPCCHTGRTGPCCEAVVNAGIKKVFVGMKDPNPKVSGRGIKFLRKNGVRVEVLNGDLMRDIQMLNQPFIKMMTVGLPYVTLKAAMSLNGKIAHHRGKRSMITGEKARDDAYLERSKRDAVVVGASTVAIDNPELAPHGKWKNKKLFRVVVDGRLRVNPESKVFRDESVLVACSDLAPKSRMELFEKNGIVVRSFGKKTVSVPRLLRYLGKLGVSSLFVEGGSITHDSFFKSADAILFYMSPKNIKTKDSVDVFTGAQVNKSSLPKGFLLEYSKKIGEDLKIRIAKRHSVIKS
jgi:diaminohydroxyphosphoribosylaminopyrimidine deaminase / 5-amino-6-(5-phosphoribosylamino)uracil reductase